MTASDPAAGPGYLFVDRPDGLASAAEQIRGCRALAVDTEADSMHSFFEKVCLVQLATDRGDAYVVDPLALRGLGGLAATFSDPSTVKVFHGADFDVMSLRRDFGFQFRGIFDTMLAGQLLGDEKLSLRDYVARFFGVTLEKAYTTCDWARRPLDSRQLEYCYHDVAFLVQLMDIQRQRLAEADLVEEAEIEFERLARREPAKKEFDPHAWFRIHGARDLSPVQQALLAQLFMLRDRHARELDRPPFKVVGNDTMVRIARAMPASIDALRQVKGVSSYVAGRMGRDLLQAVQDAQQAGAPPPRPRNGRAGDPARRLDMPAQKRLGLLKDWRSAASGRTRVTTMAILPNYAMFEVARLRPNTIDQLAAIPGVGGKRATRWGREILDVLR
jgi:ribonuclease D